MTHDFVLPDKKGRSIEYDVGDETVYAFHKGAKIGEFSLRVIELPRDFLEVHADVIDLDAEYRNAGIGIQMVQLAYEHHGQKIVPPDTYYPEKESRNTMTPEGLRLMISCQKRGWVTEFQDQLPD